MGFNSAFKGLIHTRLAQILTSSGRLIKMCHWLSVNVTKYVLMISHKMFV